MKCIVMRDGVHVVVVQYHARTQRLADVLNVERERRKQVYLENVAPPALVKEACGRIEMQRLSAAFRSLLVIPHRRLEAHPQI